MRSAEDGVPSAVDLADRLGGDGRAAARAVRAACLLSVELGAPPGALLDACAETIAREQRAVAHRRSALAGPRATARLLVLLPVSGPLLGAVLGVDTVGVLADGRVGSLLACSGVLLLAIGHRWTRREIDSAEAAGRVA